MLRRVVPHSGTLLFAVALGLLLAGCASTEPQASFSQPMVASSSIGPGDSTLVAIEVADKISVLPSDRQRLEEKIKARIDARKSTNAAGSPARNIQVVLNVTRYEKGSAFARAMLAGLGQIHLDGTISVFQMPDHILLEQFNLQKTFAWGGIYGASTSMEQIEDTFADAVAATVTGQDHGAANKKT